MCTKTLADMTVSEFEELGRDFIAWAAEWDDALPAELFFDTWAEIEHRKSPVVVQAAVVGDHLELSTEDARWIKVQDNRIRLDDGREVIIELRPRVPTPA